MFLLSLQRSLSAKRKGLVVTRVEVVKTGFQVQVPPLLQVQLLFREQQ